MERLVLVCLPASFPLGERLIDALDPIRKEKALRHVKEEDQLRSALAGLLIRRYVGEETIVFNPHGKPSIPGRNSFNVSHGGDYVGIYLAEEEAGLDIEPVSRCSLQIALAAFTEEERKLVKDQRSFAEAWTRKEAISKCLGRGIESPRTTGVTPLDDGRYLYEGETYRVMSLFHDGHEIAMAKRGDGPFPGLEVISPESLLK